MCGLANLVELGSGDVAFRAPSRHSRLVCRVGLWWSYLLTPTKALLGGTIPT